MKKMNKKHFKMLTAWLQKDLPKGVRDNFIWFVMVKTITVNILKSW